MINDVLRFFLSSYSPRLFLGKVRAQWKTQNSQCVFGIPRAYINFKAHLKYFVDLVDVRLAREEWFLGEEFTKYAAHGPHVHSCGVFLSGEIVTNVLMFLD